MSKIRIATSPMKTGHYDRNARGVFSHEEDKVTIFIENIWEDTENFNDFVDAISIIHLTELLCKAYHGYVHSFVDVICYGTKYWGNNCFFLKGAKKACNSNYKLKIDDR